MRRRKATPRERWREGVGDDLTIILNCLHMITAAAGHERPIGGAPVYIADLTATAKAAAIRLTEKIAGMDRIWTS